MSEQETFTVKARATLKRGCYRCGKKFDFEGSVHEGFNALEVERIRNTSTLVVQAVVPDGESTDAATPEANALKLAKAKQAVERAEKELAALEDAEAPDRKVKGAKARLESAKAALAKAEDELTKPEPKKPADKDDKSKPQGKPPGK